jgi:hypothetical protein
LWSIKLNQTDFIKLNEPPKNKSPMWRKDWFVDDASDKILKTKSDEFDEGKRIAFEIPVKIHEENASPKICWFRVFLEKDELLTEADSHFVRDGITITGIKKPKNKFVRAIVVIEDKALVKLLGNAENPAHTEWQKDSSHFRGKYIEGDKVISFIEKSIDNLCSLLIKPTEGIDKDLMKDIFFIEIPEDEPDEPDESDEPDGPDKEKPKPPKLEKKPSPFIIEQETATGGFIVKNNSEYEGFSGNIKIKTAYLVVKGSPLNRYSSYDFDISKPPITISASGVNNLKYNENNISFNSISGNDFKLEVKGFDEHRDLFIKANHYDKEI